MIEAQMKKLSALVGVVTAGVSYFSLTAFSYAQTICPTGDFANLCKIKIDSGSTLVQRLLTLMLVVAVILSLFFLIYGGIRWITSAGDKTKLDAARGTITAAIVGLILAFLAFFFITLITFLFTGKSITNFKVPTLVP